MLLSQIITAISPIEQQGINHDDWHIDHLLTDSRQLGKYPTATMFFALRTQSNDGANYINDLYQKGVRVFVLHTDTPIDISL